MYNHCIDIQKLAEKDDPKALAEFLKTVGMEQFADDVTDNEVSGDMIVGEGGEEIMKELGMSAVDCLRIHVLYRRHLLHQESELAKRWPVERVVEFFEQYKQLKKSAKMILKYEIDGEMLLQASDAAVLELEITAIGWGLIKKKFKDFALGGK